MASATLANKRSNRDSNSGGVGGYIQPHGLLVRSAAKILSSNYVEVHAEPYIEADDYKTPSLRVNGTQLRNLSALRNLPNYVSETLGTKAGWVAG